ncbi:MAG: ABC transporter substrate-binding protein [Desulfobacteraceae bacterium]|nr:ABC transporter substrate-binding protein [Desulfobacteraceae bacterium]
MNTTPLTRRQFLTTTAAGIGAMSIPSFSRRVYAASEETLRIGYLPITDAAPLLIAYANGYYQEEGLAVEKPVSVRTWSNLSEAFLTGKFNIVHFLLPIPIWMRFNNKLAVKVLAWDHTNGSALTVRGDSGIKSFADLKGRQIAVPYWYSMHNVILQMGLRKMGLKPVIRPQPSGLKADETNLFVLPPPDMPVSLAAGKIDGYIVAEPFNAIGEMKVNAKILRFTGDIWKNHPCCVIVMNESLVRSDPVFVQKAVNAIVRAQLWTSQNRKKAAEILSKSGQGLLPTEENVLLRVFTGYELSRYGQGATPQAIHHPEWNVSRIGFQPYPYPSATRFILKEMRETLMEGDSSFLKKLDINQAAKELVDDSFVRKAIANAGGHDKFESVNIEHPWEREEVIEL